MEILIVAGEPSGDQHGASLARQLETLHDGVRCFGVGGDRMEAAGVELLHHIRNLAVVGITEVLWHLRDVHRALDTLVRAAARRRVDGIVLIDYPDFNLTLARRLRRRLGDVPIIYYISPQVWAWRRGRVARIARLVDAMLVILPFEEEIYAAARLEVEFVGHPLMDVARFDSDRREFAGRHGLDPGDTWVGLLPGSRRAEVQRLLPPMARAAAELAARAGASTRVAAPPHGDEDVPAPPDHRAEVRFLVPVSPGVERRAYESILASAAPEAAIHLVEDDYYPTLQHAAAAAVCSGTATLETALSDTPMVVVYRTSWLTYNLAKLLVHVRHIGLVNLIAGRRAVPELVQGEVTGPRIAHELDSLLHDEDRRREVRAALAKVRERLGEPGASRRAAEAVLRVIGAPAALRSPGTEPAAP